MNKRIKMLIEQATTRIDPIAHDGACWDFDKEKFAQLIVQECAGIADIKRDTSAGCGYVTQTAGQRIKQHFGVE
jgi:hypothetical protein